MNIGSNNIKVSTIFSLENLALSVFLLTHTHTHTSYDNFPPALYYYKRAKEQNIFEKATQKPAKLLLLLSHNFSNSFLYAYTERAGICRFH